MSDPIKEKAMAKNVLLIEKHNYHRLVSFYYRKETENVITALKKLKEDMRW